MLGEAIITVWKKRCCRCQRGLNSTTREKIATEVEKRKRTLDGNPKCRCETLECKLQIGRAWWIQWTGYVSNPGTDKNCSLTIGEEIPWQGRKFLRRSFPLVSVILREACFTGITTAKRKLQELEELVCSLIDCHTFLNSHGNPADCDLQILLILTTSIKLCRFNFPHQLLLVVYCEEFSFEIFRSIRVLVNRVKKFTAIGLICWIRQRDEDQRC